MGTGTTYCLWYRWIFAYKLIDTEQMLQKLRLGSQFSEGLTLTVVGLGTTML
jgi:hypothetical protein